MKEADKDATLTMIAGRIAAAEHYGLAATARSWRELYANIAARPAESIVAARIELTGEAFRE